MSFILDALKKSETDRQQQSTAEFAAVPTSTPPPAIPRWLWVLGVLLAINLAVLLGLLVRPDPTTPKSLTTETTMPSVPDVIQNTEPRQQSSFADQVAVARENAPQPQATAVRESNGNPVPVQPDLISQNPAAIPASDLYPSIQEVRASGSLDIPDLHLDIHVYSTNREDRFVFINMAKLREGSTLAEGPVISEIVPEGVVLNYQSQDFLLPRD